MEKSTFSFYGETTTSSDFKLATVTFTFTPPENIAGKRCYLQCYIFQWDWGTQPSPNPSSRKYYLLDATWTQINNETINRTFPVNEILYSRVPIGFQIYNAPQTRPSAPILVYIPSDPHTVTFTVYKPRNEILAGATTNNYVFANIVFTPTE